MYTVVRHTGPEAFLARAAPWLEEAEDRHNLILSLAHGCVRRPGRYVDPLFLTVEHEGDMVGCAMRTPPHKLLITEMPAEAAALVGRFTARLYDQIPAVLGPPERAVDVASSWVERHGGRWAPGMGNGIYRADEVVHPEGVPGTIRHAEPGDIDLAVEWGEGFARDAGVLFPTQRDGLESWVRDRRLYLWVDDLPRSIAVAHGSTRRGVRIGYVYTPDEHRRKGYAGALVAALTEHMLSEYDFCVLYTDLSNPTSNALYERVGYRRVAIVQDVILTDDDDA